MSDEEQPLSRLALTSTWDWIGRRFLQVSAACVGDPAGGDRHTDHWVAWRQDLNLFHSQVYE